MLRAGEANLAIGIHGDMLPELRSRISLTDRHVACDAAVTRRASG